MDRSKLNPNKSAFDITQDPDYGETRPTLFVEDMTDDSNDNVRSVRHPDFDILWSNECENVFRASTQRRVTEKNPNLKALDTIKEAKIPPGIGAYQ